MEKHCLHCGFASEGQARALAHHLKKHHGITRSDYVSNDKFVCAHFQDASGYTSDVRIVSTIMEYEAPRPGGLSLLSRRWRGRQALINELASHYNLPRMNLGEASATVMTPSDAQHLFGDMAGLAQEQLRVLLMNTSNRVICPEGGVPGQRELVGHPGRRGLS